MSLRVLLLDDDYSLTSELERALLERSCEVVTIADAEQGMGAAASQRFDVILVSNQLRGANGYGLSDIIRSDPSTASVPLVVMSKPVAVSDVLASLPGRTGTERPPPPPLPSRAPSMAPSASMAPSSPSMAPSGDLRETIKNQGRVVASLRSDLAARSKTIDRLTAQVKELTQRLNDVMVQLEAERGDRQTSVATLEAIRHNHDAELQAIDARRAAEAAEREQAHAEETAFLERAHEEASEAAARRLRDSEQSLAAERATRVADSQAHTFELTTFREMIANLEQERDQAIRERDDARAQIEAYAMDVAQAQMDLAEETRRGTAGAHATANRIAEIEQATANKVAELERTSSTRIATLEAEIAARGNADSERHAASERALTVASSLEAELADARTKLAEMQRALDAAERAAAQQQLAQDAAFHDMSLRAASELEAAVAAARIEAAAERDELVRQHQHALKITRDKAIAQTLAVARERKKQG